jgi:signal transduction histidine kinase
MPRRPTLEVVILVAALIADAAVLYFGSDAAARLSLGLLLLAPIVWASARLGVVELIMQSPAERVQKRRFVRLRSQVQQLLDEIRRLNWMAVDAERGFRSREKALDEMDAIEDRLKTLIQEIRSTAGQMELEVEETEAAAN